MDEEKVTVFSSLQKKICETESLLLACSQLSGSKGQRKLQKKIEAELRFLKKLSNHPAKLKEEHLRSSNLCHLSAIVQCCSKMCDVVKILEPFTYEEVIEFQNESVSVEKRIVIDLVADHGKTWVKVVARNPVAMLQSSLGAGKFGRRSITDQVSDIISCATQNRYMYAKPKVVVWFAAGVAHDLRVLLEKMDAIVMGIDVGQIFHVKDADITPLIGTTNTAQGNEKKEGSILPLCESEQALQASNFEVSENENAASSYVNEIFLTEDSSSCEYDAHTNINLSCIAHDTILNLDVSTLIAEASNLTNGHCDVNFKQRILLQQAMREREFPVRKILDKLLKGHKLVCCQTAYNDFLEILSTVGGIQERRRASEFLRHVTVVPDKLSEKAITLQTSSKVRERARIIFGTGDSLKAVTVTANLGFLRAAHSQGIKFVAFVHESRALTELKENRKQPHQDP